MKHKQAIEKKLEDKLGVAKGVELSSAEHERMDSFLSAYIGMHPAESSSSRISRVQTQEKEKTSVMWGVRFASVFLITLIVTATGGVAFAERSLPGDVLYNLKIVTENIRENFKTTPEAKARYEVERVKRRLDEAKVLASRNKVPERGTRDLEYNLERNVSSAMRQIDAVKSSGDHEFVAFTLNEEIRSSVRVHKDIIDETASVNLNSLRDLVAKIAVMVDAVEQYVPTPDVVEEDITEEDEDADGLSEEEGAESEDVLEEDVTEENEEEQSSEEALLDEGADRNIPEAAVMSLDVQTTSFATPSFTTSIRVDREHYFEARLKETKERIASSKRSHFKHDLLRNISHIERRFEGTRSSHTESEHPLDLLYEIRLLEDIRTLFSLSLSSENNATVRSLLERFEVAPLPVQEIPTFEIEIEGVDEDSSGELTEDVESEVRAENSSSQERVIQQRLQPLRTFERNF